jgi:hypothetical protein
LFLTIEPRLNFLSGFSDIRRRNVVSGHRKIPSLRRRSATAAISAGLGLRTPEAAPNVPGTARPEFTNSLYGSRALRGSRGFLVTMLRRRRLMAPPVDQ